MNIRLELCVPRPGDVDTLPQVFPLFQLHVADLKFLERQRPCDRVDFLACRIGGNDQQAFRPIGIHHEGQHAILERHGSDGRRHSIQVLPDKSERFIIEVFLFDRKFSERVVIGDLVVDLVAIATQIVHQNLGKFSALIVRLTADDFKRREELIGRNDVLLDEQIAEFSLGSLCLCCRRHRVFLFVS